MKYFIYLVGFIFVSIFASKILSKNDPEPIGAEAGLLFFGAISAFIGLLVHLFVSRVNRIVCSKLAYFFTGLFSAVVFFGMLSLNKITFLGFNFVFLLALALTLAANVVAVFIAESKA